MRRKITSGSIVLLCLVLTIVGVNDARAGECGTIVPGGSVVGAHWTLAGSPYCVTGDIDLIGVVIDPGVEVWVDGDYQIQFTGNVTAIGTEELPILFTEKDEDDNWNGIFMDNAFPPINLEHCIIEKSDARGLNIINTTPLIDHCIIRNNTSPSSGGGLYVQMDEGVFEMWNSVIADNYANPGASNGNYVGGGGYITGASRFVGCTIAGNTVRAVCSSFYCNARAYGGGLYFTADAEIENCIIRGNKAYATELSQGSSDYAYGGGIYNNTGSLSLTNCVVACNSVVSSNGNYGGGLCVGGGTVEVMNSIFYTNNADQIYGTATVTYSNVQGGYEGEGNINYNPGFYGGDCACPDFRITPYSPCVDAGNPLEKFNDGCRLPGYGKARNDMGAHGGPLNCEWSCLEPADLNCDEIVSTADLLELLFNWGPCPDIPADCPADLNCDGAVGTGDLLILLSRWG